MHQSFYLKKPSTFTFDKSYKVFIKEGSFSSLKLTINSMKTMTFGFPIRV